MAMRDPRLQHLGFCAPVAGQDLAPLMGRPPDDLPRGYEGAPLMATLIEGLLASGLQLSVFTLSADLPLDAGPVCIPSARWPGLWVHFVPSRPRAWRPVQGRPGRILDLYRLERQGLCAAIAAARPQVVHAHWAYEFAWAALDSGVPAVVTSHDSPLLVARMNTWAKPTISLYRWLRVLMAREVLRRARHLTVVSPYMQEALAGLARATPVVVPNAVQAALVARGHDRERPAGLRIALISHGWRRRKNAQPALLAFASRRRQDPSLALHLFGHEFEPDGAAQAWCRRTPAMADALEALHFHGPLPHETLMRRLEGLDLLLHPSLEESFGMVLVEALALGLPVVAGAHSGAVPWVVQAPESLCDVRDSADIARALARVSEPRTYARLSAQGRQQVQTRFGLDAVVRAYLQTYEQALGLDARAPAP